MSRPPGTKSPGLKNPTWVCHILPHCGIQVDQNPALKTSGFR